MSRSISYVASEGDTVTVSVAETSFETESGGVILPGGLVAASADSFGTVLLTFDELLSGTASVTEAALIRAIRAYLTAE